MKKYLYDYIEYVEKNRSKIKDDEFILKIKWFQHERVIHLIITIFYAIIFLIFLGLIALSYVFVIPATILMIFLICYIMHYFWLENGIQYLYKLYDKKENAKTKK